MADPATPKPPVPGVPARKDPNPPAPQPVPVKNPLFPVKVDTQDKHYYNPPFTLDPTKEKYPEINPAHGPSATRPAKGPVSEEATKRVFTGSPYPTVTHRDSYKDTNTPLAPNIPHVGAFKYPVGDPRNVYSPNSPNYDARLDPNSSNYDARLDPKSPRFDAAFAAKYSASPRYNP
jgi:hypothetical protein